MLNPDITYIPILNAWPEELKSRFDIIHHFEKFGIKINEVPTLK